MGGPMTDDARSFQQKWAEDGSARLTPRRNLDAVTYDRYRLVGDEDCGVGVQCNDHDDGGRPFAYYEVSRAYGAYGDDPAVTNVSTIADLLLAITQHEHEHHQAPMKEF